MAEHPKLFEEKHIAVIGSVRGEHRRIQMIGRGYALAKAMLIVAHHPPRGRFLTVRAERIASYPDRYLDIWERWDRHPEVES